MTVTSLLLVWKHIDVVTQDEIKAVMGLIPLTMDLTSEFFVLCVDWTSEYFVSFVLIV
jgi:hypothetical protein